MDSVRLGLKVVLQGHCLGAAKEVQNDDAAHVHLGDKPSVVCMDKKHTLKHNQVGELLLV